jgi:hypothetical protein
MNKFIGILIGLIFLLVPIYAWIVDFAGFGTSALTFLKGGAMWLLLLIGAVSLLIGLNSLKD